MFGASGPMSHGGANPLRHRALYRGGVKYIFGICPATPLPLYKAMDNRRQTSEECLFLA